MIGPTPLLYSYPISFDAGELAFPAAGVLNTCEKFPLDGKVLLLVDDGTSLSNKDVASAVSTLRQKNGKQVFIIIWSKTVTYNAKGRTDAQGYGANMITNHVESLNNALGLLQEQHTALIATNPGESRVTCPFCQLQIPRNFFGVHVPFYHTQEPNCTGECPLCQETHSYLAVHIHDHFRSAEHTSGRLPIFALVVVRNAKGEYLLVDESASQGYWLPGGGVDPGEDFSAAAVREVKEETGVDVDLKGVLRVEFSPNSEHKRWPRMRVIFYAELKNTSPPPKTLPDFESAGACFAPHSMLKSLPLRSSEPLIWSQYLADGGEIYPLSIVARPHECPVVIHGKSPP